MVFVKQCYLNWFVFTTQWQVSHDIYMTYVQCLSRLILEYDFPQFGQTNWNRYNQYIHHMSCYQYLITAFTTNAVHLWKQWFKLDWIILLTNVSTFISYNKTPDTWPETRFECICSNKALVQVY